MTLLKKTVIKLSFDSLMDQLGDALDKGGFVVSGITDYQQVFLEKLGTHFRKYKVMAVYIPHLYQEMLMMEASDGIVLPCNITVVESSPGQIVVTAVNPTELMVRDTQKASMQNLAGEVTRSLDVVIDSLPRGSTYIPDLVTSWG